MYFKYFAGSIDSIYLNVESIIPDRDGNDHKTRADITFDGRQQIYASTAWLAVTLAQILAEMYYYYYYYYYYYSSFYVETNDSIADRLLLQTIRGMSEYIFELINEISILVDHTSTLILKGHGKQVVDGLVEYFGGLIESLSLKLHILLLTMELRLYSPKLLDPLSKLRYIPKYSGDSIFKHAQVNYPHTCHYNND